MKKRAGRNRTLTVTEEEQPLLESMITSVDTLCNRFQDDSIINGDLMSCLDLIPNDYFDLIIIDPPYNLSKDFHGNKFVAMQAAQYEDYLRSWFCRVCDKLKSGGSLYMCGDWKFLFYFIGIDERSVFNTLLCSVYHSQLIDKTILQRHWAGRSTRGVAQFDGTVIDKMLNETNFRNCIEKDKCTAFLTSLLDR